MAEPNAEYGTPQMSGTVRLRKVYAGWYEVLVDGAAVGRVRRNDDDGQWTGNVSDEPLSGSWCTRGAALDGVIDAWNQEAQASAHIQATSGSKRPKCPHGCKGRLVWVDDQWYCRHCGDEWPEVLIGTFYGSGIQIDRSVADNG